MSKWKPSGVSGIRFYEHETRRHGLKKDRYYAIRFKCKSFSNDEGLGWATDGWTLAKATELITEFKKNARIGEGPRSLKEKQALLKIKADDEALRVEREQKENIKFDTFFYNEYIIQQKRDDKERSWKSNESLYRLWCKKIIGNKRLKDITPNDIECIKNILIDKNKSPRTIHYTIGTIRHVYKEARIKLNYDYPDPTLNIILPKIENKKYRYFTKSETDILLQTLKKRSLTLHNISLLALHTGARAGECFNLKWIDIDFEHEQILYRKTKNKKSRIAYMTPDIKNMLLSIYNEQPKDRYVFLSKKGEKIKEVSNTFSKVTKEIGLNDNITDKYYKGTFHTLRHTFASWHVINGTPIYVLQKLMGHSTIQLTERYAHLAPENTEAATKNFLKALQ